MKAVILAAGRGRRLSDLGEPKPLVPLLGLSLIERIILTASRAGIDEFCVITGYRGQEVESALRRLSQTRRLNITTIHNKDWPKGNALSALKGRDFVGQESFFLLMGDHLFDARIIERLKQRPPEEGQVLLAVDSHLDNPFIDPLDATKVQVSQGLIRAIGKEIYPYNGYDTGIFYCTPAIFPALQEGIDQGDGRLSGAMEILAKRGSLKAIDIGGLFWIDIDDLSAYQRARKALKENLRSKATDGPISRHINRPISLFITEKLLLPSRISPNQITIFSFLLSLLAAGAFFMPLSWGPILGAFLAQLASIVDGCDGEVARLKFLESPFGGWLDSLLDRYADAALVFAMAGHLHRQQPSDFLLISAFLALVGSFMVSYTAPHYDKLIRRGQVSSGWRIGRDVRIFIIFIGVLAGQILATLILLALLMNLEVLRRIFVFYRLERSPTRGA